MCFTLFPYWGLMRRVGWVVGKDPAAALQLARLSEELLSRPAARMRQGGLKSHYVTEQWVPARFVLC